MNPVKTGIAALVSFALVGPLAGCAGSGYGDKQIAGSLLGAAGGAVVGSQIGGGSGRLAATAVGTLVGALAGSAVGQSLDNVDRLHAGRAQYAALESAPVGQTIAWSNPDSGHHGSVTPTRTWQAGGGRYCREYQQTVVVGGQPQSAYGTACRQPDGSWQVVN
jgi:surface antigen